MPTTSRDGWGHPVRLWGHSAHERLRTWTNEGDHPQRHRTDHMNNGFQVKKEEFDQSFTNANRLLTSSLVPVRGKTQVNIPLYGADGQKLEEYYKWQFIYAVTQSGLWDRDCLGAEVHFPKGSKGSADLKLDAALFDSPEWLDHYNAYHAHRAGEDLSWLAEHLLAVVEFKRGRDDDTTTFNRQLKPAMREKDPSTAPVLGVHYDAERLFIYVRRDGNYLRFDDSKNSKGNKSKPAEMNLHLPDPFDYLPSSEMLKNSFQLVKNEVSSRNVSDLLQVTSIASVQIQDSLSSVLRAMDKNSLVNQKGYSILIQLLATKIFDEKRNIAPPHRKLNFFVTESEMHAPSLRDPEAQEFIHRIESLQSQARDEYPTVLSDDEIIWKNEGHVRVAMAVVAAFQDYTFIRSSNSDLYQLVFYKFANAFTRAESAQFLTPLPIINFLVEIVNPRAGETVVDPCCGIADFLAVAYSHVCQSFPEVDGKDFYGADLDPQMVTLATLNMLLNGDGEARLENFSGNGSLEKKFSTVKEQPFELHASVNRDGDWDGTLDKIRMKKFDVVLTNPPFGEDRAFRPVSDADHRLAKCYHTWNLMKAPQLDLGVMFLENTVRSLAPNGRFGIVLSNSIASVNKWERVREWLLSEVRIVGLFDLPPNVFAETGVNTTIICGYKPEKKALDRLLDTDYEIFVREINNVGYEKRTSKRVTFFKSLYRIDPETLNVATDPAGAPVLLEDFSEVTSDFKEWLLGQESGAKAAFLGNE